MVDVSLALIMLLGGIVQGLAGFGLALTTVPVLILFLPHTVVPPVLVLLGFLNNLLVLHDARKGITPGIVWPLIIGGALIFMVLPWILRFLR